MRYALVGLILLLTGCEQHGRAPLGLPDSLMVDLLVDVHLADARASQTGASADSLRLEALEQYELDTLGFQEMLAYYAAHPEPYLAYYDEALDRLLHLQRGTTAPPDTTPSL